jgi:hypothetical protein
MMTADEKAALEAKLTQSLIKKQKKIQTLPIKNQIKKQSTKTAPRKDFKFKVHSQLQPFAHGLYHCILTFARNLT